MNEKYTMPVVVLFTLVTMTVWLGACATTKQARNVKETTGFLSNYGMLQEGGKDEALLVYRNPKADFSAYQKILVEPMQIWMSKGDPEKVPSEDLVRLVNQFHTNVVAKLEEDWEIVDKPGPGVLRVRGAITEAKKAIGPLNFVGTITPVGRAFSEVKNLATGTHSFVGAASVEAEVTDSVTGEILLAGVDRRVGGKTLRGSLSKWSDVDEAFKFWAERFSQRLRQERMGQ